MKGLMVMSESWGRFQRVGSGSLFRMSGGKGVLFEARWVLLCLCVPLHTCGIFLYLKFLFFSLLWRDVPYPSRPCSSATRSLKFFLFSFPDVINSLIFSVPQNFTPILLQHRHCLPVRFLSAFPVQPPSSWADGLYLTHFRSSLAVTASSLSWSLN